jgi:PilZ domain
MYLSDQRRASRRHRVDTDGVIWLVRHSRVKCTVRDLSRSGVGVALHEAVNLPAEFDLTFDGTTHRCATVWRWRGRMGVKLKTTSTEFSR